MYGWHYQPAINSDFIYFDDVCSLPHEGSHESIDCDSFREVLEIVDIDKDTIAKEGQAVPDPGECKISDSFGPL